VIGLRIIFQSPGPGPFPDYRNENLYGIETQINGFARELAQQGYEIDIIRPWFRSNVKIERVDGINIINVARPPLPHLPHYMFLHELIYSKNARDTAKKREPNVIVLPDITSLFFFADLIVPKIYVTHNPQSDMLAGSYLRRFFRLKLERQSFAKCNVIVTLNSATQRYFQLQGYNVVLIPNGVNEREFQPNFDDSYILNSGRQLPHKHLDLLIKAYALLPTKLREEYVLKLVGDGSEHEYLRRLSLHLGIEDRVQFIPRLAKNEYIDTMSKCSTFVLPTSLEGFGTVTIEAMACGKPVIVSDIAAPRDIVSPCYDGFLFKNQNVDDLISHLKLCLSDIALRKKIGCNARKTIEEKYSFRKLAQKYASLFDQLAQK
jgi:glycosyltransferase involved in cell wall biosynthesis